VLFKFDSEVSEFLSALKFGTHNIYRRGLEAFQEFYSSQGSIGDFLVVWSVIGFCQEVRGSVWIA